MPFVEPYGGTKVLQRVLHNKIKNLHLVINARLYLEIVLHSEILCPALAKVHHRIKLICWFLRQLVDCPYVDFIIIIIIVSISSYRGRMVYCSFPGLIPARANCYFLV